MRYARPIRLAPEAYANPDNAFHIIVRTHPEVGKLAQHVRGAVWESLMKEVDSPQVSIVAAVLMPDHVHLLMRPQSLNLVSWVGRWKSLSTRAAWTVGHQGTIWQRRFYDRGLRGTEEFEVAFEYIMRNPSNAGLVDDDVEWPHRWSRELD